MKVDKNISAVLTCYTESMTPRHQRHGVTIDEGTIYFQWMLWIVCFTHTNYIRLYFLDNLQKFFNEALVTFIILYCL